MKNILLCLLLILVALFNWGCASIADGTMEGSTKVLITSTPSGARVTINSIPYGVTPCRVQLNKLNKFKDLQFEKKGFEITRVSIKSGFNAVTLGNIIAGGGIGAGYDLIGGNFIATKRSVHVDLVKLR